MKIDYQDRIDEYLLNRMTDDERSTFEQDVNHDEELKEQLSFTKDVQQTVIRRNEMIAKMKQWEEEGLLEDGDTEVAEYRATGSGYNYCPALSREEKRPVAHSSGRRIIYWLSGIAAVFVAGFFLFQNLYVNDTADNYMSSIQMNEVTLRAGSDNSELNLLLSQKKYEEALRRIEDKCSTLKNDSIELAQDLTKDDEQKEYDFMIIKDKQDELKWLKAYAYLCMNQKDMALKVLNELRSTEGYYQMSADSLYQQLK